MYGFIENSESINVQFEVSSSDQQITQVKEKLTDMVDKVNHIYCSTSSLSLKGILNDFPENQIEFLVRSEQVSKKHPTC